MGTRSLTRVKNGEKELICLYRQFDGYPSGHGKELKELLGDLKIVNGLGGNDPNVANGMPCLAVQLITKLKNKQVAHHEEMRDRFRDNDAMRGYDPAGDGMAGNLYLHPPGTHDCWEEYDYTLYLRKKPDEQYNKEKREAWEKAREIPDGEPFRMEEVSIGTLCLKIATKDLANGDYKNPEWVDRILYDGPIENFDPDANYDEDE
jgi:hypothetical protein